MTVATAAPVVPLREMCIRDRPQVVLLDQPFSLTVKKSINCMIAFLPHALAAAIVQILSLIHI